MEFIKTVMIIYFQHTKKNHGYLNIYLENQWAI